jgi:hypothetical protein
MKWLGHLRSLQVQARIWLLASLTIAGYASPALANPGCDNPATKPPDNAWLEENQVRIGDIRLDTRDVFDTSKPGENKSLYRLANFLHINTRASTIRDQLLFQSGDVYSPRLLDESERLLRKNRYFYDARIFPAAYCNGVVDITVRTRDVWTLNVGASGSRNGGANKSNIELEELNLFGFGSKLSVDMQSDVDRDSVIFEYTNPHIGHNQLGLSLKFADNTDGDAKRLLLERPFFALDSRWAAGFEYVDDERLEALYDLGEPVTRFQHSRTFGRVYGGLSKGLRDGWVSRWTAGLAYDANHFQPTEDEPSPVAIAVDRTLAYPFVGYELRQDRFSKTRNHDQIGRTEDIYMGTHVSAELGYSSSAFGDANDSLIYRLGAGTGVGDPEHAMWLLDAGVAGRYENSKPVDTRLSAEARYYRRQSANRLFFFGTSLLATTSPVLDDPIYLGGASGLRGYPLRYQGGDSKVFVTVEQRFFTNKYPFKLFRVGGAVFADLGRTWGHNALGGESLGWLGDIGFGLRLSPTRSGSGKIINIDIAFPLQTTPGMDKVQFLLETRRGF